MVGVTPKWKSPPCRRSDSGAVSEVPTIQRIQHEGIDLDTGPACDGLHILAAEGERALFDDAVSFLAGEFERQLLPRTEEHLITKGAAVGVICFARNRRTGQTRSQRGEQNADPFQRATDLGAAGGGGVVPRGSEEVRIDDVG